MSEHQPTLLVRTPNTYLPERRYILGVVLSDWLGLAYELSVSSDSRVVIQLAGDPLARELTLPDSLFSTSREDWLTERAMPVRPLAQLPCYSSQPVDMIDGLGRERSGTIPVLFGEPGSSQALGRSTPTGCALNVDILGSVFFLLTRYEEVVQRVRDQHDRYPATASLAMAERFLERPIADEYVDLLWTALHRQWPTLARRQFAFTLQLTHDVDQPWAVLGQRGRTVAHELGRDVLVRHDPAVIAGRIRSILAAQSGRVDSDPYNTFDFIMDTSERFGLRSTFNFMASDSLGERDGRYSLSDPPIAALLRRIHERGHEVGLHATYGSYRSAERVSSEFKSLKDACGRIGFDQATWGVRQHYLRFDNPHTWRNHEAAGIDYDSTLGYADASGFRAGTCREYPLFDLLDHRPLDLRERPLLIMDGTLSDYLNLDVKQAHTCVRRIVAECKRMRGVAVLLYHNSRLVGDQYRDAYRDVVEEIVTFT